MSLKFLSIMLAALLSLSLAGCGKADKKDNGGNAVATPPTSSTVEQQKDEVTDFASLEDAEEYLDEVLNFEKNYLAYIENENIKGYKLQKGDETPLSAEGTIKLEGKSITLPAKCSEVADALSLTYADSAKDDEPLSGGATVARGFKTADGEKITLALYSEEGAVAEACDVVGISFSGSAKYSFSAMGIDEKTTLADAVAALGKPEFVAIAKVAEGISIDLQYTSGDFARLVFDGTLKLSNFIVEFK